MQHGKPCRPSTIEVAAYGTLWAGLLVTGGWLFLWVTFPLLGVPGSFMAGIVLASYGLASSLMDRRIFLVTVFLAIGIFGGLGWRVAEGNGYLGLPRDRITRVQGVVVEDSRWRGRWWETELSVHGVEGRDTSRTAARLRCLFRSPEGPFWRGMEVEGGLEGYADDGALRGRLEFQGWTSPVARLRAEAQERVRRLLSRWEPECAALFTALFLGDRHLIPTPLYERFREAGALHVLALSGLHAGIIVGLLALLLRPLPGSSWKPFAAAAGLWIYVWFVGPYPSLLRASLLVGLSLFLLPRKIPAPSLLGTLLLFMVLFLPRALFSLSGMLSMTAFAGIVFLAPLLRTVVIRFLPDLLAVPLSVGAGAFLGTAPVVSLVFSSLPLQGLLSGLFIVPCAAGFLLLGIARVALEALGGTLLAGAHRTLLSVFLWVVEAWGGLPSLPGPFPGILLLMGAVAMPFVCRSIPWGGAARG
ncbi:ComEC/Rec2-related protein [Spirochaeta thermophila DSM 6578]|uniref:ComEC/Rec2-related protein n=1 Tax=Winmispira thermophila (strain ATCC 700085 / DSM 6578 / Z-1203) TaxID=869211 RepID=G0GFF8_WINT7|nr:ComEC/Rec2 family competence protein [Spirochaeta thermophila]AEJ61572.1 ComEC/Rec2-related protein [Spirochaeta thermophila DSM 6578]